MNSFIDSHAHIYLNDFNSQIENIIDNSIKNNVDKILMPNINFKTVNSMKNLSLKYEGICFSMLGLHPCYVEDNYEKEINDIFDFFDSKVIAIGEIGLDYFQSEKTFTNQLKAFKIQCEIAIDKKLPIVIHTRNTIDESIILNYNEKDMTNNTYNMAGTTKIGKFSAHTGGFGDSSISTLIRLSNGNINSHISVGISLPTGSTTEEITALMPSGAYKVIRAPYGMQLGTGTYDVLLGYTLSQTN